MTARGDDGASPAAWDIAVVLGTADEDFYGYFVARVVILLRAPKHVIDQGDIEVELELEHDVAGWPNRSGVLLPHRWRLRIANLT